MKVLFMFLCFLFVFRIRAFQIPDEVSQAVAAAEEGAAAAAAEATAGDFVPPQITDMYIVTAPALPLFSESGHRFVSSHDW